MKKYSEREIKTALGTLYGSRLKTKSGQEIQAGVKVGNKNIHIDAGYDRKRGTKGAGVTFINGAKKTRWNWRSK